MTDDRLALAFLGTFESLRMGPTFARGRRDERAGHVRQLTISGSLAVALVRGPDDPVAFRSRIAVRSFGASEWARVEQDLVAEARYAADLLAGRMPAGIGSVFAAAGLSLVPLSLDEVAMDCACERWPMPCVHLAATCYAMARSFEEDPFGAFAWRGRPRDELLLHLRELRSVQGLAASAPPGSSAAAGSTRGAAPGSSAAVDFARGAGAPPGSSAAVDFARGPGAVPGSVGSVGAVDGSGAVSPPGSSASVGAVDGSGVVSAPGSVGSVGAVDGSGAVSPPGSSASADPAYGPGAVSPPGSFASAGSVDGPGAVPSPGSSASADPAYGPAAEAPADSTFVEVSDPGEAEKGDLTDFWGAETVATAPVGGRPGAASRPDALLDQLDPPPLAYEGRPIVDLLRPAYLALPDGRPESVLPRSEDT